MAPLYSYLQSNVSPLAVFRREQEMELLYSTFPDHLDITTWDPSTFSAIRSASRFDNHCLLDPTVDILDSIVPDSHLLSLQ